MTARSKRRSRQDDQAGGDGQDGNSGISEIQARGLVGMAGLKKKRAKGVKVKVNWNEMGQPIGKESMTLAHFIGSYVRRTFRITIKDWRDRDLLADKEKLWDEIKVYFFNFSIFRGDLVIIFYFLSRGYLIMLTGLPFLIGNICWG